MQTTIDSAGRLVVPKGLRDEIGLRPGPVEVRVEGTRIVIEPPHGDSLVERDGLLVIPASGAEVSDATVRDLLEQGRR